MAKFNTTSKSPTPFETTNFSGGIGYARNTDLDSKKQEIASIILNSMLKTDSYYQSTDDRLNVIETFFKEENLHNFLAKTAVYVRNEGYLRSISHFLVVLIAENIKGSDYARNAMFKTLIRGDDLTEIVSLWNTRNPGKMIPNSLRRALKDKLEIMDDYQLRKYQGKKLKTKLRDVAKLARPNPEKSKGNIKALIEGKLPAIQTAQTINAGGIGEERAENYREALQNKNLGLMAALKNIKNILESGADSETISLLNDLLRNDKAILNSKILPFRYLDAWRAVKNINSNIDRFIIKELVNSLEYGFSLSAKNIEFVEENEKVAILLDESGSMDGSPFENGRALTASLLSGLDKKNTIGYLWATRAREINIDGGAFDFMERTHCNGGGTDLGSAFSELRRTGTFVDKIIIFTDMQQNGISNVQSLYKEYRKINPAVKILFWNLEGYGSSTPIKLDNNVLEVCGFSDKILELIPLFWKDKQALVHAIENVQL